eukprot:SAG31_NODE_1359_length_8639_cov_3.889813_1_plen_68_part_00
MYVDLGFRLLRIRCLLNLLCIESNLAIDTVAGCCISISLPLRGQSGIWSYELRYVPNTSIRIPVYSI